MHPDTIREIRIAPFSALLIEPFGISRGAQASADNVLVEVVLENGTAGYGEAAPLPPFNGETQDFALAALERARPPLIGERASRWRDLAPQLTCQGSARCALECAMLDASARSEGVPLWRYFGGKQKRLHTDYTVTQPVAAAGSDAAEHARQSALRAVSLGAACLKVKVGGVPVAQDRLRIEAAALAAPDAALILDGNAAMSADDAVALVNEILSLGIAPHLFEQPVASGDWAGMRSVRAQTGVPVAVDEALVDLESARTALREAQIDVFNIKLMKSGVARALEIVEFCERSGVRLMIGGMVETSLAMTFSANLAGGRGGFAFVDLDTPLFIVNSPVAGGARWSGTIVDLDDYLPGSGLDLNPNWKFAWR